MKCPFCGNGNTQVIDSRFVSETNSIRRRRKCLSCDKRFNTFETAEYRMPNVVKITGNREIFSEDKLRRSLERALHKRAVPTEKLDEALESIKQNVLQNNNREISSREIGEKAMEALFHLDRVAYVRFASIYKSFTDLSEFEKEITQLLNKKDIKVAK